MASILTSTFRINGVISTDKTVVQNINDLCTACGAWATYDIAEGKWSVIINKPGNAVADFDDSNIIGSINISGTGVTELYNGVLIEFPHKDLEDQTDFVEFEIPPAERFPNELENVLNIRSDLINDPVQAQYVSVIELKQSRVDKVIQFSTDYAIIGLKAGDLISVTSSMYGYDKKKFRITKIEENDGDDGTLAFSITALEYDSNIYNSDGLTRKIREKKTGIVPKSSNQALSAADQSAASKSIVTPFRVSASTTEVENAFNAYAGVTPWGGVPSNPPLGFAGDQNTVIELPFTLGKYYSSVTVTCESPIGSYDFKRKVDGVILEKTGFYAYVPCEYKIYRGAVMLAKMTSDWQTQNATFPLVNLTPGTYSIRVSPLPTYDLNQQDILEIYPYNIFIAPQTAGGGFTATGIAIV